MFVYIRSTDEEKEAAHTQNVIDVIQGEGLMSVVKVICDWMICNSTVIMTCAQVSSTNGSNLNLYHVLSSRPVWCYH